MRHWLWASLLLGICFNVRAMSPDSLGAGGGGSSSSHGFTSDRGNWHRVDSEVDRGNHRVIDDATWTLDEIRLSHALQTGRLREFDVLQIERDRLERMEQRDRALSGQTRNIEPRPNPLTSGYLRTVRDPLSLIIPNRK